MRSHESQPRLRRRLVAAVLALALTACGQKGDLYLPGEEQALAQSASPGVALAGGTHAPRLP